MPRLRRRLRLLDEWKEQIRGGLWYKPAWWDAVRNVPPLPAPARVKKSDVPTIRFVEEQLIKDFASKNPSIAQYDAQAMIEDAENQSLRSVAATFAKRQVAEMQAGKSKDEAYSVAKAWLLENGKEHYERLQAPEEVQKDLTFLSRTVSQSPEELVAEILAEQRASVRASMADAVQTYIDSKGSVAAARGTRRGVRLVQHKNLLLTSDEIKALQSRGGVAQATPDSPADGASDR